jgi:hypothetical protein
MQHKHAAARLGSVGGILVLALASQAGNAQFVTAETFDIDRYLPTEDEFQFETFYVEETRPLRSALDAGIVTDDTPLLVTETAAGPLALLTGQMAFHHIAQGTAAGKDWMATF